LVYLLDEGSEFDATLDEIWKYLPSEHHNHPSLKVLNREVVGNSVIITSERNIMGKPTQVKIRNTLYSPFGIVQEHLEGPLKGSKAFQFYIPKGNKTGITVVGDYIVEGLKDEDIKRIVLQQAQITFEEDNSNLKKKS
jgi:hypothetical protein